MAELIRERLARLAEALPGVGDPLARETAALPGNPYVATVSRRVRTAGDSTNSAGVRPADSAGTHTANINCPHNPWVVGSSPTRPTDRVYYVG